MQHDYRCGKNAPYSVVRLTNPKHSLEPTCSSESKKAKTATFSQDEHMSNNSPGNKQHTKTWRERSCMSLALNHKIKFNCPSHHEKQMMHCFKSGSIWDRPAGSATKPASSPAERRWAGSSSLHVPWPFVLLIPSCSLAPCAPHPFMPVCWQPLEH